MKKEVGNASTLNGNYQYLGTIREIEPLRKKRTIMILKHLFILVLSVLTVTSEPKPHQECSNQCNEFFGAQIIFFYFPYKSEAINGQIALYYYNPKFEYGDRIVLITQNETIKYLAFNSSGTIASKIRPKNQTLNDTKFSPNSVGYCAYWERRNTRSKQFCMTTRPTWMYELKDIIGDQFISSIIIPGTHQSGSYSKEYPQPLVERLAVTQDQDILEQLIFGARFLDLRPGYTQETYYNVHGMFFKTPMQTIINDIKTFLNNTQEIVIVSFKEFPIGFEENERHEAFIQYIITEFDGYFVPKSSYRTWNITLNEIWTLKKRLMLTYYNNIYVNHEALWPPIVVAWGNVAPGENLNEFIASAAALPLTPLATMATYTMQSSDVVSHTFKYMLGGDPPSLRGLAVSVGPSITMWYNEKYFDTAQIVAVDYIQCTGIVEVAIEWNKRRFSPCYAAYKNLTLHSGV